MASKRRVVHHAPKVRHLLSIDANNVMTRLAARGDAMVGLFSRLRDREPMLSVLDTWFDTIVFSELSQLEPHEQKSVNRFYELLAEVRWYLAYTEEMPLQVQTKLTAFTRRLEAAFRELMGTIGHPEANGAPVVDVRVVSKAQGKVRRARARPRR